MPVTPMNPLIKKETKSRIKLRKTKTNKIQMLILNFIINPSHNGHLTNNLNFLCSIKKNLPISKKLIPI